MSISSVLGAAAGAVVDAASRPFLNAHFVLAIDGLLEVDFATCSGLSGEVGVEEYAEGGENRFAHRFPGRASHPNLVLGKGAGAGLGLWDWWGEYLETGFVKPRDGQVHLLGWVGEALVPVRVWEFRRGFPVKMAGPDLDAGSPAVAIETLEIAHHGLRLVRLGV